MNLLTPILHALATGFVVGGLGFILGYTFGWGREVAGNRHRKVCDVCFRDIKQVNKLVKENNK